MKWAFVSLLSLLAVISNVTAQRQVICYIATWGTDVSSKVDTKLCSTFVIAFASISGNGAITVPSNINNFLKLKTATSKLTLSLGGGTAGVAGWRSIAGSATTRSVFAQNCLNICRQYGLDGVDVDWEFPDTADRASFVALHQSIYSVLNPAGLILTTAVSAGNWLVNSKNVYDIPALNNYVYGFHLMTYNIHMDEDWDISSGVNFNAPKMSRIGDSLDQGIRAYLSKGASASKTFVGVPFYSRTYRLQDSSRNTPGSPFVPGYQKSDPTNNVAAYFRYCPKLADSSWIKRRSDYEDSPYMYKGSEWISYEDVPSIARKSQLANSTNHNIGGVLVWAIHQDDIDGICGGGRQPLLRALNNAVGRPTTLYELENQITNE